MSRWQQDTATLLLWYRLELNILILFIMFWRCFDTLSLFYKHLNIVIFL